MNSNSVLIVEDDPEIAESLKDMLEILEYHVVGIAEDYDSAIKYVNSEQIDIALLDIQLKGEKSGIDVAEILKSNFKIPFIFTTAYADKETIKKASEHSPYGYIVKPYGMKDINAGIEVALENHKNLKENEDTGIFNSESLFIKTNSKILRININDILFVEAKGDYAIFKTLEKGFIVSTTFKNVEDKLDANQFVRVHRSYIVNIDKVVDIEENNLLINEQVIPISRSQKPKLLSKLNII